MSDNEQKQLGKTLWNIADQLRGAMNADDFRDYMRSFLARTRDGELLNTLQAGFKYIENESFESTFQGLF